MDFDVNGALRAGYSLGEIADEIGPRAGFDVGAARKAGYSDDEIVQTILSGPSGSPAGSAAPPPDTSAVSGLRYGVHNAGLGLASTADKFNFPNVAASIRNVTPDAPANYQPAGEGFTGALKAGNYLDAAGYLPRMGVESAPDVAGAAGMGVAGAVAGAVMGGPAGAVAGGFAGPAAYSAARNAGQNIDAVAANNNHAAPTAGDYAQGLAATAPQAALDAVGIGRVPGVSQALGKVGSRAARVALEAGLEGGAAGARDSAGQLLTSAGTERGATVDPYEVLAATAGGAAGRLGVSGAREVPGAVAEIPSAVREGALNLRYGARPAPQDVARLQTMLIDFNTVKDGIASATGRTPADREVFGTLLDNHKARLNAYADVLAGMTDDQGRRMVSKADLDDTVKPLIRNAVSPDVRLQDAPAGSPSTPLSRFKALPIPDDLKDNFTTLLRNADTVKAAMIAPDAAGPGERLLGALGKAGTIGTGLYAGGLPGAALAALGYSRAGALAGGVGRFIDQRAGTGGPALVRQMRRAAAMPDQSGVSSLHTADSLTGAARGAIDAAQVAQAQRAAAFDALDAQTAARQAAIKATGGAYDKIDAAQARQKLADLTGAPLNAPDATLPTPGDVAAATRREIALYQGDPMARAQAATNLRAFHNASTLASDGMLPTNGVDSPTATLAALAQSARAANRVHDLAAQAPGGETASVTGNAPDPIPVNIPTRRGGDIPAAQGVRPAFRPDTPAEVRAALTGDVPAASMDRPTESDLFPPAASVGLPGRGIPQDAMGASVSQNATPSAALASRAFQMLSRDFLANHGHPLTQDDVEAGIDLQRERGIFTPAQAEALKTHTGWLNPDVTRAVEQGVKAALGLDRGGPAASPRGSAAQGARIWNPQAWEARRQDVKAHVAAKAEAADAAGFSTLAEAIRQIGAEKTAEGKAAIRDAFLEHMAKRKDVEGLIEYQQALGALGDATLLHGV